MFIPSLQILTNNCIVKEVWTNSKAPQALLELAVAGTRIAKQDELEAKTVYHQVNRAVLNNILALNLPLTMKVKIAVAYIKLKEDIAKAVRELTICLKEKTKENIAYCIAKVIVNNGKVDRSATVLKILHDSYFTVNFCMQRISRYCHLPEKKVYSVYESLVKCKNDISRHKNLRKRILEMSEILKDTFQFWKFQYFTANNIAQRTIFYSSNSFFEYVALNAPLDIVKFVYTRLTKPTRLSIISKALLSALLSDQSNEENILFLFQKLSRRKCFRIFLRFHENIFKKLYLSFYGDFCLNVFRKLWEHSKHSTCKKILYSAVKLLHSTKYEYDYGDIKYAHSKEIFLKMWLSAPDNVKLKLGKQFYQMLDMLIDKDDFHFVSILINDSTFTRDQKYQHTVHIVSKLILESNSLKLEALEQDCPTADIACIKENMTIDVLKMILLTKCESYTFDALSVFFETQCHIKQELLNDRTFAVNVISTIAQSDEQVDNIQNFLKWIFNDNEEDIEYFIQISLVSDLWLVDICKRYLLETSSQLVCPEPTLLDCFDLKDEDIDKIKSYIRKDIELVNRLCEYFTCPQLCQQVSNLLECLFNDGEEKEKQQLLIDYFISERGLTCIFQLFESKFYNEDLYRRHGFLKTIEHYFDLIRNWFEYQLSSGWDGLKIQLEALQDRWHPHELRIAQDNARKVLLLPCEFTMDHVTIVNCNFRMFQCILKLDHHHDYFGRVQEELWAMDCTLTEYCRKFEDRIY